MRMLIFLSLFLIFVNHINAQGDESYLPKTGIKAAYLGSAIYPGFNIGVERPYQVIEVNKNRFKNALTLYKESYVGFSMSMYVHPDFHTNIFIQAEWAKRRQYSKGFYIEGDLGAGISRTFLAGATYEVSGDGQISKIPHAGKFYGLISFNAAIGYNLGLKGKTPLSLYLKPGAIVIFPYNRYLMPQPAIALGAIYRLSGFWESTPKYTVKKGKETHKKEKSK